jgi:putative transposase
MTKRRQFSAKFKFQVALDALKGMQTINEIASQNEVHPTQVKQWKKQLQDEGAEVFSEKASKEQQAQAEVEATLYEQIGRLKVELHPKGPRLKKKLPESAFTKCLLVEPDYPRLSIRRQCELLALTRSTYYYQPATETPLNLTLMALIDREYTDHPFYGRRKMTIYLRGQGYDVNPKRVRRLMRKMGLEAIYPKPRTTVVDREHRVYPYLLRGVEITRPNQVWSTDITYIPMQNGFMYLTAVIDWYSRYVLAWQLSNRVPFGRDTHFCRDAVQQALQAGLPDVFNTDQGSQFTSLAFTSLLEAAGIRISMDGKGRALDNIFVAPRGYPLWRSVKYEDIYLNDYATVPALYAGLSTYFRFYNHERPHQSLANRTPAAVYQAACR